MALVSGSSSGSGAVLSTRISRAASVGGNITTANTAGVYVELAAATGGPGTGGFDLTVAAATNDVLLVAAVVTCANSTAVQIQIDLATIVTGSPVNWIGQSAGGNNNGLATLFSAIGGTAAPTAQYVVQAGDISGGSVVLRTFYLSTGVRVINRAVVGGALMLAVSNLRQ